MDLELSEFKTAQKRIKNIVHKTPIVHSSSFSSMSGGEIYLKLENQQKTGSFKSRGAGNKITKLLEEGNVKSVVAASAGNHAQGVAYAATQNGIKSTIVMPEFAPIIKVQATRGYGANVVLHGEGYDDAYSKACEICEQEGATFLHPYDDLDVIAGQGTIALEILEEVADADVIITPAGGGGLLAGVATCAKKINPNIKVYGVQAEQANAIAQSFAAKKKICTKTADTIADGIAVKNPGDNTLELIYKYVDDVITVSEVAISDAIISLMERTKQVVEPAGATPVAAVLSGAINVQGKKVVCVLSGGNIDVALMNKLIVRGLAEKGRYATLYVTVPDRPHGLSRVLMIIDQFNGKILAVENAEAYENTKPNQMTYCISITAEGTEHLIKMFEAIKALGYQVVMASALGELYKNSI